MPPITPYEHRVAMITINDNFTYSQTSYTFHMCLCFIQAIRVLIMVFDVKTKSIEVTNSI